MELDYESDLIIFKSILTTFESSVDFRGGQLFSPAGHFEPLYVSRGPDWHSQLCQVKA
jgi:hypothetical protein